MSTVKLIAALFLGIVLLCAVTAEGYFYFYSQKQNSSADDVAKSIQNALKPKPFSEVLAEAKSNLQAQTEKLNEMQASFPDSPALDAEIKADVSKATAEAAKADALVADPKLDLSKQPNIVALGKQATEALAYLQTLAAHNASTVVLNDAARNAVDLVAAYSKAISEYVDSLNAGDSGLTPPEIASYEAQAKEIAAQAGSVEDSLNQIDSVPAGSPPDSGSGTDGGQGPSNGQGSVADDQSPGGAAGQAPDKGPGSNVGGASGSGSTVGQGQDSGQGSNSGSNQSAGQNSGQASGQTGGSQNGQVTLGDIVNQENAVNQTSVQVDQLEEQAPDQSGNPPAASPSPSDNPSSFSDGGNGNDSGGTDGSDQSSMASGTVRLIQAENNF